MKPAWLLWLGLLSGCAAAGRTRIAHTLDSVSGLVVSNAPAPREQPEPRLCDGRLAFDYPILAENLGASSAVVDLVGARAALAPETRDEPPAPFRIACREHTPARRSAPVAVLAPRARIRIDCRVELSRELTRAIASTDREVVLALPVRAGERSETIAFSYLLYSGDTR